MSFLAMEGSQKCFDTSTRNHPIGGNRYQIHSLIHKLLNVITTHFWITTRAAQTPFCRKFGFMITHFFKSFSDKKYSQKDQGAKCCIIVSGTGTGTTVLR